MKLAISNLAWPSEENETAMERLADLGVSGLEIAPAKIFSRLPLSPDEEISAFLHQVQTHGLSTAALQAFLFGRPDLKLFDDAKRPEFLAYTKKIVRLAQKLGAPAVIYGAPKSRDIGERPYQECWDIAKAFFRTIGEFASGAGVTFCIEPNPKEYGCNFIVDAKEARKIVLDVASPGFGLNLDTACMYLAGDDPTQCIRENADIVAHFHVSEPALADFSQPHDYHNRAAAALKTIGYDSWISIEMLPSADPQKNVSGAVEFVKRTYLS